MNWPSFRSLSSTRLYRTAILTVMALLLLACGQANVRESILADAVEGGFASLYEQEVHLASAPVVQVPNRKMGGTLWRLVRSLPRMSVVCAAAVDFQLCRAHGARAPPHSPRAPPMAA